MGINNRKKAHKTFIIILFLTGVSAVFYYSWLPDPSLKNENYLPQWLLNWSNHYINLRTAVPFVAIGYLIEVWTTIVVPSSLKKRSPFRLEITGVAILIVSLAEVGQFFIANRHPDFMDIVFGIIGGICGSLGYYFIQKINSLFFYKNAK